MPEPNINYLLGAREVTHIADVPSINTPGGALGPPSPLGVYVIVPRGTSEARCVALYHGNAITSWPQPAHLTVEGTTALIRYLQEALALLKNPASPSV